MGFKIEQWSRRDIGYLAAMALILWAIYLKTMSPAFPANDSPETISAAFELGIQHPPGYPLHTLLGRLAILASPGGSPAWDLNCLSAALGVCAAVMAAFCAREYAGPSPAGWTAAFFACGLWRSAWEQATEAKGGIYLLNLSACLGLLAIFINFWRRESPAAIRLFFLLSGLALANHYMSALLFFAPLAAFSLRKKPGAWPQAAWMLPGLSLYLVLPMRASWEPFNNLGDASSLSGFLWVVLRRGYSQMGLTGDWGIAADQARLWALHTLSFGAYAVAPLALGGLWFMRREKPLLSALLAGLYGVFFVSVVLINRTLADVRWLADIFMLPGQALLGIAAAAGLLAMADMAGQRRLALPLALALAAGLGLSHYAELDRSGDFTAYDFGANMLDALPRGAFYAADGDYHYMPLLYRQQVQGRRQDAELLVATMMADGSYRQRLFRRRGVRVAGQGATAALEDLASQAGLWVSPFHPSLPAEAVAPKAFWQHGLAMQLTASGGPEMAPAKDWVLRLDPREKPEPLGHSLLPWYAVALVNAGNQYDLISRPAEAALAYQMALQMPGDKPKSHLLYNLGRALEKSNDMAGAMMAYQNSLEAEPGLEPSRQRAAALAGDNARWKAEIARADACATRGDAACALPIYRAAASHGYQNAALWRNIGVLSFQRGDFKAADAAFARAQPFAPSDPVIYKYRVMTLQRVGSMQALRDWLSQGVRMTGDPDLKHLLESL